MNEIDTTIPAIPEKQVKANFDKFTLEVTGDRSRGEGIVTIRVPYEQDGVFVREENITFGGEEYNAFWENYNSDKQIVEKLFPEANTEQIPDTIPNVVDNSL